MENFKQLWQYYTIRLQASQESDRDRGEVSATTVVMAAALIGLAIQSGSSFLAKSALKPIH